MQSVHLLGDVVRVLWDGPGEPESTLTAALATAGMPDAVVRETSPDMETVFAYLAESVPSHGGA